MQCLLWDSPFYTVSYLSYWQPHWHLWSLKRRERREGGKGRSRKGENEGGRKGEKREGERVKKGRDGEEREHE